MGMFELIRHIETNIYFITSKIAELLPDGKLTHKLL